MVTSLRRKKARMAGVRKRLKDEGLLVSMGDDRTARVSNMIVFRVVGGERDSGEELQFRSVNPEAAKGLAARLARANSNAFSTKKGRD